MLKFEVLILIELRDRGATIGIFRPDDKLMRIACASAGPGALVAKVVPSRGVGKQNGVSCYARVAYIRRRVVLSDSQDSGKGRRVCQIGEGMALADKQESSIGCHNDSSLSSGFEDGAT